MPINFVRNPLLNPHESKAQSLYSPFVFEDPHTQTHSNSYIHTQKGREWVIIISVWEKGEGADGFYLRCDGSSTVNKRERGMGV